MRNLNLKIVGVFVVLFLVTAWPALAQSVTTLAKADIPFDFVVGQKTMPAGEYAIGPGKNITRDILLVQRADNRASAYVVTFGQNIKRQQAGSFLLFNRYGDKYFLSQLWTESNHVGRQAVKSAQEKELIQAAGSKMDDARQEIVLLRSK